MHTTQRARLAPRQVGATGRAGRNHLFVEQSMVEVLDHCVSARSNPAATGSRSDAAPEGSGIAVPGRKGLYLRIQVREGVVLPTRCTLRVRTMGSRLTGYGVQAVQNATLFYVRRTQPQRLKQAVVYGRLHAAMRMTKVAFTYKRDTAADDGDIAVCAFVHARPTGGRVPARQSPRLYTCPAKCKQLSSECKRTALQL